jgi:hypothetical protein
VLPLLPGRASRTSCSQRKSSSSFALPPETTPIAYLALYYDGMACRLCPSKQPYICKESNTRCMQYHLKTAHIWQSGCKRGQRFKASLSSTTQRLRQGQKQEGVLSAVTIAPVAYQTFHRSNFLRYFQVAAPPLPKPNPNRLLPQPPPTPLEALVEQQLAQKLQAMKSSTSTDFQQSKQLSAWLETTQCWI